MELNKTYFTKEENNFVTHVVLLWLDKTRCGDRTVTVPDCLIKARGKEAANIVNCEHKFNINDWLRKFLYKLRQEEDLTQQRYATIYPDIPINGIIEAEWSKFFSQNEDSSMVENAMNSGHNLKVVDVRSLNSMEEMDIMLEPEPEPDPSLNMAEMLPDPSISSTEPATSDSDLMDNSTPKKKPRKSFTKDELLFIDHVVSIWAHQRQRGDLTVVVTDRVLKTRAKEAACIINNECKLQCSKWLKAYKAKRRLKDSQGHDTHLKNYPYNAMYDIIEEEWWKFFGDNSMKTNDTRTKYNVQVDETELTTHQTVDTIQSYCEFLDCLKLLEIYAIDMRNIEAVLLVAQIEDFLQNEVS